MESTRQRGRAVPATTGALDRARRRHPSDVVRVVLGLAVLVVASLPVRPDRIGRVETGAFDLVNGLPDPLFWVLWLPMQLGSLVAVPLVVAVALVARRRWLALEATIAGTTAWTLAKVVKDHYARPRPGGLLDTVVFRGGEPSGFGFVSGHTAVAVSLATVATLYLPRRWRRRVLALAGVVGLARIFVGAHLPLDVVGGAGLGLAIAAAVRLVLGAATGRPTVERVRAGMERLGFDVDRLEPLSVPAVTSAVYRVTGPRELFVKVLSDRPQDRDAVYRWWLRLRRRVPAGAQRFASPSLQVQTEAARTLAAAVAGVRVPDVLYSGPLDAELSVLVTSWVEGDRSGTSLQGEAAADARRQVERLHACGIAHGDLAPEHLLVHGDTVTVVDLGDAVLRPDESQLARDRAALAALTGSS